MTATLPPTAASTQTALHHHTNATPTINRKTFCDSLIYRGFSSHPH